MDPIKPLLIAALIACSAGCSALPQQLEVDQRDVKKLAWTKGAEAEAFVDQHGVCHAFARDNRDALQVLGQQVQACFSGSLPQKHVNGPRSKIVEVAWNKVPRASMAGVYAEATRQAAISSTGGRWRSADGLSNVRGFFTYDTGICHVVVPDQPDYVSTLGHEFKHCVDGYFHDNRGEWHDRADRG